MNAKNPVEQQLAYSSTKAALCDMVANLAKILGKRGIRANAVLPGPIWTPLIPATMYAGQVESYGAMIAVTGGMVTI